ncbi:unnamed protein product, partial [Anisakis simplex]|uniref:Cold-shock protein n=1 Tax=Anisakis simplex TaxID=6269 RepID=A0A0M3JMX5_ANISI
MIDDCFGKNFVDAIGSQSGVRMRRYAPYGGYGGGWGRGGRYGGYLGGRRGYGGGYGG